MEDLFEEYLDEFDDTSFTSEMESTRFEISFDEDSPKLFTPQYTSTSNKKFNKRSKFSVAQKHELAKAVECNPIIWDLSHSGHFKTDAVNRAWKTISEKLGKPISECKSTWASLRDSKRYRAQIKRKSKSGDDGGEFLDNPVFVDENAKDWEFSESLAFLPNISKKRRTCTIGSAEDSSPTSSDNMLSGGSSNYKYVSGRKTSSTLNSHSVCSASNY
ncbi:uncharacterized protein LOC142237409 [Haematobia irritans]|uniref:uncharacterized protein LOC142237409 n=1 Tax=Haematobia irritans TaxID=7368 RepID=UPI003F4F7565